MVIGLLLSIVACGVPEATVGSPFVEPTTPSPTADTGTPSTDDTGDTVVTTPTPTADTGVGFTGDTAEPPEPDPGAILFDPSLRRVVEITMDPVFMGTLAASSDSWVPATLSITGFPTVDTGVRLKGNGSFQPIDQKPSFKLELDHWVDGSELDGLDELVLNNMVTDSSGLREHTSYAVYRELGIPAPRSVHVEVRLNGAPYGTYLLLEDVDGRFLKRWFDDNDGPLYEMFDVDLTPEAVYQLDHDGGPDDRSTILALAEVLADPTARVMVEGAALLDIDQFTAYFGASGVVGQFDAYPYSFPGDDVYLYVDPTDGKIRMLPHGGDETFSDPDRPVDYVFGLLATRCMAEAACEERFDAAVWRAMDVVEGMDLVGKIDAWGEGLPALELAQNAPYAMADVGTGRAQLRDFVSGRRERLARMPGLEGP